MPDQRVPHLIERRPVIIKDLAIGYPALPHCRRQALNHIVPDVEQRVAAIPSRDRPVARYQWTKIIDRDKAAVAKYRSPIVERLFIDVILAALSRDRGRE